MDSKDASLSDESSEFQLKPMAPLAPIGCRFPNVVPSIISTFLRLVPRIQTG